MVAMSGCDQPATTIPKPLNKKDNSNYYLPYYSVAGDAVTEVGVVGNGSELPNTTVDEPAGRDVVATVTDYLRGYAVFQSGDYDRDTYTISNYHATSLLYPSAGGLYRLTLNQEATPVRVRVSNEATASLICQNSWRGNDFAAPQASQYLYQVPGPGNDCTAGRWKMVTLSMTEADAPVDLPSNLQYPVEPTHHADTAALNGWLAVAGGALVQYDAEFNVLGTVRSGVTNVTFINRATDKQFWLVIDGALHRYDPVQRTLSTSFYQAAGLIEYWISDGEYLYFADNVYTSNGSSSSGTLRRVRLDGTAPQALVRTADTNSVINGIDRTTERVILRQYRVVSDGAGAVADSQVRLESVTPDGTSATPLLSAGSLDYIIFWAAATQVYAELQLATGGTTLYTIDPANAAQQSYQHRRLAGRVYNHDLRIAAGDLALDLVVLQEYDTSSARVSLASYAAGSNLGTPVAMIGTFGAGVGEGTVGRFGFSGRADGLVSSSTARDLFFIDARRDGSLVSLPTTPKAEFVLDL